MFEEEMQNYRKEIIATEIPSDKLTRCPLFKDISLLLTTIFSDKSIFPMQDHRVHYKVSVLNSVYY